MKLFLFLLIAAVVALVTSTVAATPDIKLIVDQDNSSPFFIGSEKLATISSTLSTAVQDYDIVSAPLGAALSSKYDNATINAWRHLVSGNATVVATAGPALSGNIKCFVGDDGEVIGLQYGSAVVCRSSARVVNIKIGRNYVSNIKVVLGENAVIAGLQFVITNGISGSSTVTHCGTRNGLSAYIGKAGKAVGAIGGSCSTRGAGRRRRLLVSNATSGLNGSKFASVVVPAPQGENNSPPFGLTSTFTIDGQKFTPGDLTNGTAFKGRRLGMRRV